MGCAADCPARNLMERGCVVAALDNRQERLVERELARVRPVEIARIERLQRMVDDQLRPGRLRAGAAFTGEPRVKRVEQAGVVHAVDARLDDDKARDAERLAVAAKRVDRGDVCGVRASGDLRIAVPRTEDMDVAVARDHAALPVDWVIW